MVSIQRWKLWCRVTNSLIQVFWTLITALWETLKTPRHRDIKRLQKAILSQGNEKASRKHSWMSLLVNVPKSQFGHITSFTAHPYHWLKLLLLTWYPTKSRNTHGLPVSKKFQFACSSSTWLYVALTRRVSGIVLIWQCWQKNWGCTAPCSQVQPAARLGTCSR